MFKRMMAMLLCLCMLNSVFPVAVFAEGEGAVTEAVAEAVSEPAPAPDPAPAPAPAPDPAPAPAPDPAPAPEPPAAPAAEEPASDDSGSADTGNVTQTNPDGETDVNPDGETDVNPDGETEVNPDDKTKPEEEETCTCDTACTAEAPNADCPVCAAGGTCAKAEPVKEPEEKTCSCEKRCTEEEENADCPVCSEDIAACEGKEEEKAPASVTVTVKFVVSSDGSIPAIDDMSVTFDEGETSKTLEVDFPTVSGYEITSTVPYMTHVGGSKYQATISRPETSGEMTIWVTYSKIEEEPEEKTCICEQHCTEEEKNAECPVCSEDITACEKKAAAASFVWRGAAGSYSLSASSTTVEVGSTLTINGASSSTKCGYSAWSSSNGGVATVDGGVVTGVSEGKATITHYYCTWNHRNGRIHSYDSESITITVTKKDNTLKQLEISAESDSVSAGETLQLTAVKTPSGAEATLVWSSSDPNILTVDGDGLVTGLKAGSATVTVKDSANETILATKDITVNPVLTLTPESITLTEIGQSQQLTAETKGFDGMVTWTIEDAGETPPISVQDGLVTRTAQVSAPTVITIIATAEYNGSTLSAPATVNLPVLLESIAITANGDTTVEMGQSLALTAAKNPEDAADTITWHSSDESVLTVVDGVVMPVSAGTAQVWAASGAVESNQIEITVKGALTVTPAENALSGKDDTCQLTAEPLGFTPESITWSVSGDGADLISVNGSGLVTQLADVEEPVTATVTATADCNGEPISASAIVNLTNVLTKLVISSNEVFSVEMGKTLTLTIEEKVPANATDEITWHSSNDEVLVVEDGKVIPVSVGKATVWATGGNVTSNEIELTVTESQNGGAWVYVYTQVTGNTDGLVLNGHGWYTLGRVYVPGLPDANRAEGGTAAEWNDTVIEAVRSGFLFEYNTSIPIEDVSFGAGALKIANGADDYVGAGTSSWHLDGSVDVAHLGFVVYKYVDENGKQLRNDSSAEAHSPGAVVTRTTSNAPAIDGYICTSVTPSSVTVTRGNIQYITYHYTRAYTVTYTDGVDNEEVFANQTYRAASGAATPAFNGTPTRTGYTFAGWEPEVADTVTGNATYVAQWTINKYTVTWVNDDGTELEKDENVPYGTTPKYDGTTPTKAATAQYTYTFTGWTPDIKAVEGDVTYTAVYTPVTRAYTVTWKNWDGTVLETDTDVLFGTTPTYDGAAPTRAATAQYTYTFTGWTPDIKAVEGNVTYTAVYTPVTRAYTVTWENWNGNVLETDTGVPFGEMPVYNGVQPFRAANAQFTYIFDGWTPDIRAVSGNVTYTATFIPVTRAYTVTWVNENGAVLEVDTNVPYGTMPSYDGATPTKAATDEYTYTFDGWTPDVSAVTGNATYTATFTAEAITPPTEEPVHIEEETVPLAVADIPDEGTPLASGGAWALINLILTILTALGSLLLLLGYLGKKDKAAADEDGNPILNENGEETLAYTLKKKGFWRLFSLIPAIGAIIAFILTEDMRLPMVLVDKWTILMVIIALVQLVDVFLCRKKKVEPEEQTANV